MKVLNIYKKLLGYFGPQGWWPIFDTASGKCEYHTVGFPNPYSQRFEICVGAILTQNTTWKNVERALKNLSPNIAPDFIIDSKSLEELIKPAGYYNQKAKKLRIFSKWWLSRFSPPFQSFSSPFQGKVRRGSEGDSEKIQGLRQELLSLWGIGPETADSILLYAFEQPIFVIDAYTKRLCKEFEIEFKTYDEYREFFESRLPSDPQLFNEYHALIVAWGKLHTKNKEKAIKNPLEIF
ncbi:hypothetical protein L6259_00855 [Candidatus Parcubacteria bacterium]|nr:hypothetical protein [Patescibacteria group bacterium]MCG2693822.1 hypothetical protein [Candidatus Parcubacteria bacterium]